MTKHGRLSPVVFHHKDRYKNAYWVYKCDCGKTCIKRKADVNHGSIKSCGCLAIKHGMTGTRTYKTWRSMLYRCLDKNYPKFRLYGGRGITVCPQWKEFEVFLSDMGERPEGKSLDRIDSNGNYEPSNCRWATAKEQNNNSSNNRLLTYKGKTLNVTQWADELGFRPSTIFSRLNQLHWPVDKTLSTPRKGGGG